MIRSTVWLLSIAGTLCLAVPCQAQFFPGYGSWQRTYQGPTATNFGYGRTSLPRSSYYVPAAVAAAPAVAVPALPSPVVYAPPVPAQTYPPATAPVAAVPMVRPVVPAVMPAVACPPQPYAAPCSNTYVVPGNTGCPPVGAPSSCQPTFTPSPY